jgi:hypothetical protein
MRTCRDDDFAATERRGLNQPYSFGQHYTAVAAYRRGRYLCMGLRRGPETIRRKWPRIMGRTAKAAAVRAAFSRSNLSASLSISLLHAAWACIDPVGPGRPHAGGKQNHQPGRTAGSETQGQCHVGYTRQHCCDRRPSATARNRARQTLWHGQVKTWMRFSFCSRTSLSALSSVSWNSFLNRAISSLARFVLFLRRRVCLLHAAACTRRVCSLHAAACTRNARLL